jgi:hypothetical protein
MPEPTTAPSTRGRRTFVPVVLLGLASAGLAALAGGRTWATLDRAPDAGSGAGSAYDSSIAVSLASWPEAPLVTGLAFVVLAAWGVLLVTRRRVRRAMAVLALAASLGVLVAAIAAWSSTAGTITDLAGQTGSAGGLDRTLWPYVAIAAGLLSVLATALAVRLVPSWPEMGTRYDAPGSAPPPGDETGLDLWRALDEGRDPTLPDQRSGDVEGPLD